MAKVVIIGAGLTGLSAAYHLEKNGFFDFELFEKEDEVGGLCRSKFQDGFTFDYTGHLLHINDQYFGKLVEDIVGINNFEQINRRSYIYSKDTYTHYPFQVNLKGLPSYVITECIEQFVQRPKINCPKNFYQWVQTHFGEGLGKHFFFPFQNKIFDYNIKKITPLWTGRFVPQTSLKQMIEGAIKDPDNQHIGYNSSFYYPKDGGIQFWVNKLATQIKTPIKTGFAAQKIDLKNKTIKFDNGHIEKYQTLINTAPLDIFLKFCKESSDSSLQKAIPKLLANSVVNFNLGINRENLSDKHWIYFPEEKYPFYRMGFPHNFAKSAAPKNCSSLYGEFSFTNKPKHIVEQRLKESLKQAKEVLQISDADILTECIIHIKHAYVIYNQWRDTNISKIHAQFNKQAVHSIGRYGEWKYSSMQEAVLDGKKVVDQILFKPAKLVKEEKYQHQAKQTKEKVL